MKSTRLSSSLSPCCSISPSMNRARMDEVRARRREKQRDWDDRQGPAVSRFQLGGQTDRAHQQSVAAVDIHLLLTGHTVPAVRDGISLILINPFSRKICQNLAAKLTSSRQYVSRLAIAFGLFNLARMISECSRTSNKLPRMIKNVQKMFKNVQECSRTFRNVQERSGPDSRVRICWNIQTPKIELSGVTGGKSFHADSHPGKCIPRNTKRTAIAIRANKTKSRTGRSWRIIFLSKTIFCSLARLKAVSRVRPSPSHRPSAQTDSLVKY
ncbi:unnamed protein product [Nesidiocoris tenuis]|uniref:Uncharacterized protein n=1 Tax=Nesidiocoris tenuis TaxID=355587 RepID=A0A6H5H3L1_9HEMI|nr:unnamed protein product [Nesidiocoris tenuis]